jgi:hypothetical protein
MPTPRRIDTQLRADAAAVHWLALTRRLRTPIGDGKRTDDQPSSESQPAGDAAQGVRRSGLCPGLDRSFGCEAELIGLVVAQEPAAGSDLARNGMVTLYVAAPGSGPMDEEPGACVEQCRRVRRMGLMRVRGALSTSIPRCPAHPLRASLGV